MIKYVKYLFMMAFVQVIFSVHAQSDEKLSLNKGIKEYQEGNYEEAKEYFEEAYAKNNKYSQALYNAANSAYRAGDFEKAMEYYNKYASGLTDKMSKAKAYHNIGNAYLQQEKYVESINAYKKSLRNNPYDEETRYNLSYALSKLQQSQDQNKDQQKDQYKVDQANLQICLSS